MAKTTETLDEFYRNKCRTLSSDFPQDDGSLMSLEQIQYWKELSSSTDFKE
ncbi:hypothetical protein [Chryseobacterium sp. WLY505]|uniref:hypothetical protein n=1 Tax=Chryseobacterium sp. WLY505 TaxID=3068892 RepID=UPI002796C100|nr:hypothetical protein [Chryseobacterium sp. WLY505]MDQ1859073.1 hypothetical protein [Chryseobacterium sp. WLY505]